VTAQPLPITIQPSHGFSGNDGNWSTFIISAGTPPQEFHTLVSTSSLVTWLAGPQGCQSPNDPTLPSDCASLRGATDNSQGWHWQNQASSTYKDLGIFLLGLNGDISMQDAFGSSPVSYNYPGTTFSASSPLGQDTVLLNVDSSPSSTVAANSSLVSSLVDLSFFQDTLGIGHGSLSQNTSSFPSLLDTLAEANSIPSRSFGYTAGAYYRNSPASLVLGGYDSARVKTQTTGFSMPTGQDSSLLRVSVQSIIVDSASGSTQSITASGQTSTTFKAIIDSTLPYLYLPESICNKFESLFGLTYDNQTGLYTISPTNRAANSGKTIRVLVADAVNGKASQEISLPYAAFDLNATWPIYDNSTSYFPIRRSPSTDTNGVHILGRAFLQEAYVVADYERGNFSIGQANAPTSQIQSLVPIFNATYEAKPTTSHSLSKGAIAGIAIGAAAGAILLAALLFWYFHRRKRHDKEPVDEKTDLAAAAERERRQTVGSTLSGVTEMDAASDQRPRHSRQISELSDSSGDQLRTFKPPDVIYEMDGQKAHELEDGTDTTAWAQNQQLLSQQQQREQEQRFELQGDLPLPLSGRSNSASVSPHSHGTPGFSPTPAGAVPVSPEDLTPNPTSDLYGDDSVHHRVSQPP
jgi:Eukaryotic aspartyl protease